MGFWLTLLALGLWLPAALAGAAGAQDLVGRTLLARGDNSYPPYEFLDQDGEPAGFNVDLFKAIAQVMGLKAEVSLGPWDEIRRQMEQGEIDVITGMYYSADRAKRVDFSNPHIIVTYAIFVREGQKIKAFDELGRKSILVQKGDYADDYLSQHFPRADIRRVANPFEALKQLAAGQADCALAPRTIGLLLARRHGLRKLTTAGPPVLHRKYCFAVKRNDTELLAALNEGLAILHASGEYERIYNKWFGEIERHSAMDQALRWVLVGLAPLLLLIALAFLWTWSLKRQVNKKTEELVGQLNDRRRAEMALQESEERLRLITDNLPNAVLYQVRATTSGQWKFTYISANVQRANEVPVAAVLADPNTIFSQIDPAYRRPCAEAMRAALAQLRTFRFEIPCILPSGQRRWFELASTPRRLEDNSIVWDGVQVDITERVQHEEEKGRLEALLRQSQKMEALGTLSGGIAHDFNNILGVIMGYAEVAQLLSEQGQANHQEVGQIVRAAGRARDLVRQILTFSRRVEANLRPLDINQVITQI
ncbi:MAG: transporter substrate-binding domain-containing protein, partial [Pseudomonadota bacterium]